MRKIASLVLVLVAFIMIVPQTMAQTYTVQPGDTGWELSRQYYNDATVWQRIVDMNPFLQEPGRVFEDRQGRVILRLRPGEQLAGLERLNVTPPSAVPLELLVAESSAQPATTSATSTWFDWLSWVLWLMLGALAIAMMALGARWLLKAYEQERLDRESRERELRQDPVTSGPPIVAGGVQPNETERLSRTLATAAVSEYVRMNPNVDRNTVRVERIGPVEEGMISGEGNVGYADRARPRRVDPPQPGYRARFRFPDGREDNLMSLQGCMNPCYYGEGLSGFTFTPRQQVVPAPEPARPTPEAVPHPAIAVRRIREAAAEEGATTLLVDGRIITIERGLHFDLDGEPGSVKVTGGQFEMMVSRKSIKQVRTSKPRATGTSGDAS